MFAKPLEPDNATRAAEESTLRLVDRIHAGDDSALETLFARYLPRLRSWARGRLPVWARDANDTDDLVQETLICTIRGLKHFEPSHSGAFAGYLHCGLLNRIRDEIRRFHRRPVAESVGTLAAREPSPIDRILASEERHLYETALEQLSEEDREAILARFELDLSWAEVADLLGKPSVDAARVATKRAVDRLSLLMIGRERG
jgi:RNA polymerase sigma-70 factor (ECF subfamily)